MAGSFVLLFGFVLDFGYENKNPIQRSSSIMIEWRYLPFSEKLKVFFLRVLMLIVALITIACLVAYPLPTIGALLAGFAVFIFVTSFL